MACLWFLVPLWWNGALYGPKLRVFVLWFLAPLATQFASRSNWVWIAGFLGQVTLQSSWFSYVSGMTSGERAPSLARFTGWKISLNPFTSITSYEIEAY